MAVSGFQTESLEILASGLFFGLIYGRKCPRWHNYTSACKVWSHAARNQGRHRTSRHYRLACHDDLIIAIAVFVLDL